MIQWVIFCCSMIFGFSWLVVGLLATLIFLALSFTYRSARPLCITAGSFLLGGTSFVHMLMVPIQNEIGVPERLYSTYLFSGVSFGDLVAGKFIYYEMGAGLSGALCAIIGGLFIPGMITRLVSQLENIPTSKAGSAAIGLAEFEGIVRPSNDLAADINWSLAHIPRADIIEGGDIDIPGEYVLVDEKRRVTYKQGNSINTEEAILRKWSAFYLEDNTGRILIDPRKIDYGELTFTPFSMADPQALYLIHNWEATKYKDGARVFLKHGDRVYVIGSVQINKDALPDARDSERLVVRPKTVHCRENISAMKDSPLLTGSINDIFVLTDDQEKNLVENMRSWRMPILIAALILLVVSALYFGYYLRKLPPFQQPGTISTLETGSQSGTAPLGWSGFSAMDG